MAKLTTDELIEAFKELSLIELSEFVKAFEETFDVTAAAPAAVAAAPAAGGDAAAAEEEQTEFDVILADVGASKMQVIKTVKELTGVSLMEAKKLVETPNAKLKEQASKADAEDIQKKLEELGAKVELK